ncbi:MAG: M15 family metallopeptidase [Roseburia sp.]|nr:M15 family metallopeptidase [Roseburia sp.]
MNDRERRRRRRRKQRFTMFAMLFGCCFVMIGFLAVLFVIKKMPENENMSFNSPEEEVMTEDLQEIETMTEISRVYDVKNTEEIVSEVMKAESEYQRILALAPGECAANGFLEGEMAGRLFYEGEMEDVLSRIQGISYRENPDVGLADLAYLRMLYCGADGNTYVGEMIVNQKIKEDVLAVFRELYESGYVIERMVLVDEYRGDDQKSMEANNTSAFNYRTIAGSSKLSNHSYGMAIDVNPKYNPYVKAAGDGSVVCQPEGGRDYVDRTKEFAYKIDEEDLAYRLFTARGFTWGGSWNSVKDYQHFEKQ